MTKYALRFAMTFMIVHGWLGAREVVAAPRASTSKTDMTSDEIEARARFEQGRAHFDAQEYREAVEQFRKSVERKPTRSAMGYIASSLKQLGQYEDALSQYEEMRRTYPDLPPKTEQTVTADMAELAGLVGTLVVTGDAPPGASLFIDDRLRGKLPLQTPLRVSVGNRVIRVERDGFEPILQTVEVAGRKENEARLVAKTKKGRLVVNEKHNWALHVEVDGKDVGVTPYRGLIDIGEHKVRLHGFMGVEELAACETPAEVVGAGAKIESDIGMATVRLYDETNIVLDAEEKDASLKIESSPSGAVVMVDQITVGKAPWDGRLSLGEHLVEVKANGYFLAKQKVTLERRKQREISMLLEPEPDSAAERREARNAKIGMGLGYGLSGLGLGMFALTGGMAVELANTLAAKCGNGRCPSTEDKNLDQARTLSTLSNIGLVTAGVGAVGGTLVFLLTRPGGRMTRQTTSMSVGVQPSGLWIKGTF